MRRVLQSPRARLGLLAVGLVVALLGGWAAVVRTVRARVVDAVVRRGGTAEVDWVWPGASGWELRGVRVRFPESPSIRVDLDAVHVSYGADRRVRLEGVVLLEADRASVLADVSRLRERWSETSGGSGRGEGAVTVVVEGLSLHYVAPGERVVLEGIHLERAGSELRLGATKAEGVFGGLEAVALEPSATLHQGSEGGWELRRGGARALTFVSGGEVTGGEVELGEGGGPVAQGGLASLRAASQLRGALERVREHAERWLSADARIELRQVRGELSHARQPVSLGPALFVLAREEGQVRLEYYAGTSIDSLDGGDRGLVVKVALPRSGEPLELVVRGGPISLSDLGVKDGDFHLSDTALASVRADAKLSLSPEGDVARFDGEARVDALGLSVPAIAREPMRGLSASFRGKVEAATDGRRLEVERGELELGQLRMLGSGKLRLSPRPEGSASAAPRMELDARYSVPLVPCQTMLDAAPRGLLPTVSGIRMAGSFAIDGHARFDTGSLDKTFDVGWKSSCTCRVTDVPPAIDVARFARPFKRTVPSGEGRTTELETGPGTAAWASFASISRFMEAGVIGFEDGRFHRHEGFDHEAIRNSIRENLRAGRFVRGASTISMQLAKNLYLPREKTLSRKLEEAILTLYLEQALTKPQILELYLNVVEFGPMVYGVDAGAAHYFNSSPARLTASQAFYLASILPNPTREHFAQGGQVSAGWLAQLRTVMRHAHKRGRLSDEEIAKALAEIPVRGSPTPLEDPDAPKPPTSVTIEEDDGAGALDAP